MERAEWLKQVRSQAEALYDHIAPAYWDTFGRHPDATHRAFIDKFLGQLQPHSDILDAGCGAGRYDGMLLEAGHRVLGVDQSARMLARAREHFPQERFPLLRYEKRGLQELPFEAEFDGAICVEAMEHICPEDWPRILGRLCAALKPDGILFMALDMPDWAQVSAAYERARSLGLPAVPGEVVDELEAAFAQVTAREAGSVGGDVADHAVYHYYPGAAQVRSWFKQAGLAIEQEGTGDGYEHLLLRKKRPGGGAPRAGSDS